MLYDRVVIRLERMMVLRKIKKTAYIYGGAAGFALIAAGLCILPFFHALFVYIEPVLVIVGILFGLLYFKSRKILRMAQLIMDNEILHIQPAKMTDITHAEKECFITDIHVSCFGVLSDNRVFQFNLDNIRLKKVEIGHSHISFIRKRKKHIEEIRIAHFITDRPQLEKLIVQLRYETGIETVVIKS